jgi:hypothetical protein
MWFEAFSVTACNAVFLGNQPQEDGASIVSVFWGWNYEWHSSMSYL